VQLPNDCRGTQYMGVFFHRREFGSETDCCIRGIGAGARWNGRLGNYNSANPRQHKSQEYMKAVVAIVLPTSARKRNGYWHLGRWLTALRRPSASGKHCCRLVRNALHLYWSYHSGEMWLVLPFSRYLCWRHWLGSVRVNAQSKAHEQPMVC
jgi:hypothetical protein